MKKTTKKMAIYVGAFLVFSLIYEFKDIVSPTPLSRARERFAIKVTLMGISLAGVEIFAKE